MQRSYPLRWLAFATALFATQCLDSISDDCSKTLTCNDEPPTLRANCVWRYPNGQEWTGGPTRDPATGRWRWPDGKETETQNFSCTPADAGADAGPAGPDCRKPESPPCDDPYVCDTATGDCVRCVDDTQCSSNTPVGDAGAATVCDSAIHKCVECLRNVDCASRGDRPICKADLSNSAANKCVQCQEDGQCSGDTPACDENTNECTARCTVASDCKGENKPFCNFERNLCVECTSSANCTGPDTQCKLETNACVECIDDAPCSVSGKVCDTTRNTCVQCRDDVQCAGNPAGPHCDTDTNLCVQCLTDLQCPDNALSRCSLGAHVCVGCTDSAQCEGGLVCNPTLNGGSCVQCVDASTCTTGVQHTCETSTGRCVECLSTSECRGVDLSHCETDPGVVGSPQYTCVGCKTNPDCSGKGLPGLCREGDGKCVSCLPNNAECSGNAALSKCGNDGECTVCSVNTDCQLVEDLKACKAGVGCVECTVDGDCSGGEHCKTSNAGAAAGPAAINTCVECRSNADCTSADKSRCVDNACTDCIADADCNGADGLGITVAGTRLRVCDAGNCVQCTGPKRTACGEFVCDSRAKTCSTTRRARSAALCGTCVSDQECATTARCIQQTFASTAIGAFCVPVPVGNPASCNTLRPYVGATSLSTLDVAAPTPVCTLRGTTCPGLLDQATACDQDADCGANGVADGLCVAFNGSNLCTTPCVSALDCTGAAVCMNGCSL